VSSALSADWSQLSSVARPNSAATRSLSITMHGGSMGRTLYTVGGKTGHTVSWQSAWVSDTSILSLVMGDVKRSASLVLTSCQGVASWSAVVSTDRLHVSLAGWSNQASTGSSSVTVLGSGMGAGIFSALVRLGWTSSEATVWAGDTSATCFAVSGIIRSVRLSQTVGRGVGSATLLLSIGSPLVSTGAMSNAGSTGAALVTVYGLSLGSTAYSVWSRAGHS
jgi:hypothetical protein